MKYLTASLQKIGEGQCVRIHESDGSTKVLRVASASESIIVLRFYSGDRAYERKFWRHNGHEVAPYTPYIEPAPSESEEN